jgi:hypothetical protein
MSLFKKQEETPHTVQPKPAPAGNANEVAAAIGMALNLYLTEKQDTEKAVLTMNKVMRQFSPWSLKHFMMNRSPR